MSALWCATRSRGPVSDLYMQLRNAITAGKLAAAKRMGNPPQKQK
jgi:hypothetical protein